MLDKPKLLVSFSGGKTSGYMSLRLKREFSSEYNIKFVFANTGLENEETLQFVRRVDEDGQLDVQWIECVVNPQHGKGVRYRPVTFETASRNGEPFEAFIAKSGVPNMNKPQCSDRLKALVIEDYKRSIGWLGCLHAIGIRKDEEQRRANAAVKVYNLAYPMLDWPTLVSDQDDVTAFWEEQSYGLNLEAHEGNCKTCWKKSDKKLWLLALEHPERFEFMARMERTYGRVKPNADGTPRVFFRRNRSVQDLLDEARAMDSRSLRKMIGAASLDTESGCSESCEAYTDENLRAPLIAWKEEA